VNAGAIILPGNLERRSKISKLFIRARSCISEYKSSTLHQATNREVSLTQRWNLSCCLENPSFCDLDKASNSNQGVYETSFPLGGLPPPLDLFLSLGAPALPGDLSPPPSLGSRAPLILGFAGLTSSGFCSYVPIRRYDPSFECHYI
jgi:hypothetical protein